MESEERERDEWSTSLRLQPSHHHALPTQPRPQITDHLASTTVNIFFPIRRHPELVPAMPRERSELFRSTTTDLMTGSMIDSVRPRTATSIVTNKKVNMARINELAQPPARRFGK